MHRLLHTSTLTYEIVLDAVGAAAAADRVFISMHKRRHIRNDKNHSLLGQRGHWPNTKIVLRAAYGQPQGMCSPSIDTVTVRFGVTPADRKLFGVYARRLAGRLFWSTSRGRCTDCRYFSGKLQTELHMFTPDPWDVYYIDSVLIVARLISGLFIA